MNSLILYGSNYGNTQKIAEIIAKEIGAKTMSVSDIDTDKLKEVDFLLVGTPIIGWKPIDKIEEFLSLLQPNQLKGIKATTFDTRVKLIIHGDAMHKVAKALKNVGAEIITDPMPFYVAGPQTSPYLLEGEIEKAKSWAQHIQSLITST